VSNSKASCTPRVEALADSAFKTCSLSCLLWTFVTTAGERNSVSRYYGSGCAGLFLVSDTLLQSSGRPSLFGGNSASPEFTEILENFPRPRRSNPVYADREVAFMAVSRERKWVPYFVVALCAAAVVAFMSGCTQPNCATPASVNAEPASVTEEEMPEVIVTASRDREGAIG